jgi:hypothetical protein
MRNTDAVKSEELNCLIQEFINLYNTAAEAKYPSDLDNLCRKLKKIISLIKELKTDYTVNNLIDYAVRNFGDIGLDCGRDL